MGYAELVGRRVEITKEHAEDMRWAAGLRGVIEEVICTPGNHYAADVSVRWDNGRLEMGYRIPEETSCYSLVEDERVPEVVVWPDDLILEP